MQDEQNVKMDKSSFEGVEDLKYLGIILMNRNAIQEEIKKSLKSGKCLLFFGAEAVICLFAI